MVISLPNGYEQFWKWAFIKKDCMEISANAIEGWILRCVTATFVILECFWIAMGEVCFKVSKTDSRGLENVDSKVNIKSTRRNTHGPWWLLVMARWPTMIKKDPKSLFHYSCKPLSKTCSQKKKLQGRPKGVLQIKYSISKFRVAWIKGFNWNYCMRFYLRNCLIEKNQWGIKISVKGSWRKMMFWIFQGWPSYLLPVDKQKQY